MVFSGFQFNNIKKKSFIKSNLNLVYLLLKNLYRDYLNDWDNIVWFTGNVQVGIQDRGSKVKVEYEHKKVLQYIGNISVECSVLLSPKTIKIIKILTIKDTFLRANFPLPLKEFKFEHLVKFNIIVRNCVFIWNSI